MCMICSTCLCMVAFADNSCGENAVWSLEDGVLTVSGNGKMNDFNSEKDLPWYNERASVKKIVVSSGITHIGDMAFYGCTNAETAEIADTVQSIGMSAFSYTEGTKTGISNIDGTHSFAVESNVSQARKDDEFCITVTLSGNMKHLSMVQCTLVYDDERISVDADNIFDSEWYNSVGKDNLGYISEPSAAKVNNTVRMAYISMAGNVIDEHSPLYTEEDVATIVAKIKFKALEDISTVDVTCFSLKDCAVMLNDNSKTSKPECSVVQLTSHTVLPLSGITFVTTSDTATQFAKDNSIALLSSGSAKNDVLQPAEKPDEITVYIDGEKVEFDVKPILYEDKRTLVPLRAILEKLGAAVTWDDETQTAMALKGNTFLCCQIDNTTIPTSKGTLTVDVPAKLINDRTLVPIRAISETFDYNVEWIEETMQVIITSP